MGPRLRLLVAPNALRGSLDAVQAAEAIVAGVRQGLPAAEITALPVADGGDGTVEAIHHAVGGTLIESEALDPRQRPIRAPWLLLPDGRTAVIAMSSASGTRRLSPPELNPMLTTSYGTGQLIQAALDRGCRSIILGIGGSATVDGGAGALQALGVELLDAQGTPIGPGGAALADLQRLELEHLDPRLAEAELIVACDVENPLLGPQGAARVFGPQKGATPRVVASLERNLAHFAEVVRQACGIDLTALRHGGAAGGLGAALHAVAGARLQPGSDVVLQYAGFDSALEASDLVITAEGKLDSQTAGGKAPYVVARRAHDAGIPAIILVGQAEELHPLPLDWPFDVVLPIVDSPMSLEAAIARTPELLRHAAERVGRMLSLADRWPAR